MTLNIFALSAAVYRVVFQGFIFYVILIHMSGQHWRPFSEQAQGHQQTPQDTKEQVAEMEPRARASGSSSRAPYTLNDLALEM